MSQHTTKPPSEDRWARFAKKVVLDRDRLMQENEQLKQQLKRLQHGQEAESDTYLCDAELELLVVSDERDRLTKLNAALAAVLTTAVPMSAAFNLVLRDPQLVGMWKDIALVYPYKYNTDRLPSIVSKLKAEGFENVGELTPLLLAETLMPCVLGSQLTFIAITALQDGSLEATWDSV